MNLSSRLKEAGSLFRDKPAYIFEGEKTSYGELNRMVDLFAASLKEMGVEKGDHVALLLGNSPYFVISYFGAIRAGASVIPVNPIYTPSEIAYILNNGDVKAVAALDLFIPLLEGLNDSLPALQHVIVCETPPSEQKAGFSLESLKISSKLKSFTSLAQTNMEGFQAPELEEDEVAVILYTSGTTGTPKGAMLTHKNLYSNASDVASYLKIGENDNVITALPMFHVFCMTVSLNAPLMAGATLLILPKFSPAKVFRVAKNYQATVFAGVPTMYNFLLQYPEGNPEDFQSFRLCISGGASMPVALLKGFEQKFKVVISEGYGLSEASPVTCFNPLDRPRKPGSIGTSILNVENKVVDELGSELPAGQVGELIVRGPNVMKGYYKMPEETAHTIRNGWLYTGDLARKDEDGYFYIVDRKKDMIIVGGYNVYPREIEEALYDHPDIVEAAVFGVPDENYGEAVKCFAVSKNKDLTEEMLLDYCHSILAKYKVPESIEFLDELPKNTTGKILRRALKNQVTQK
ncbi:fatty acid--CoA ligase family protein [Metabacillus sp. GX 13764]|uniref:fatty acid--CoA ligase family protein n=1 Tax=Metabacillus kandeliae TaxID=2900151 RepID=UPI001E5AB5BC|nr:fatty acid--CoA ligase family protein [Metabacillus kandeliae]MCD7034877.1 fatty acid--CoA ligase family protein [Metabacillus kandeliae]